MEARYALIATVPIPVGRRDPKGDPGELNIRNLLTKLIVQGMPHFMLENVEGVLVPGEHYILSYKMEVFVQGRMHFMLKNVEVVFIPGEPFILYILKEMIVKMVLVLEVLRQAVMKLHLVMSCWRI